MALPVSSHCALHVIVEHSKALQKATMPEFSYVLTADFKYREYAPLAHQGWVVIIADYISESSICRRSDKPLAILSMVQVF